MELARSYKHIIPKSGIWPQLKRFTLLGAAIGGRDLFEMLVASMPRLCHVKLATIELTSWSWEGIFEGLRFKKLLSLELPQGLDQLRHRDKEEYPKRQPGMEWHEYPVYIAHFRRDIESYVVNGGRHPSLPAGAPDWDAREYLEDYYRSDHQYRNLEKIDRYKRAWRIPKDAQIDSSECSLVNITQ